MSRHYIELKAGERDLLVAIGYDRPLNEFFIIIEALSSRGHTIEQDGDPYLLTSNGHSLGCYRQQLTELNIAVPDTLFTAVEDDAEQQVGNYVVEHFSDGRTRVVVPKGQS